MINILFIALGGGLGSVTRYLSAEVIVKFMRGHSYAYFPFHTLLINVAGSMLAGILYYFIVKDFHYFDLKTKNFLTVGFLGGFTTFSAFSLDFFRLFVANQYFMAFSYAIVSVVLAITALFFGFYLMKIIF